jgi:tetratricopeptide (TPR) repeat protein
MSILLKAVAGLFAGAIVGVLTFAFFPRLEPAAVAMKPAVEQPKFMSAALAAPSPANAAASAAMNVAQGADKAAMEKLAMALRGSSSQAEGPADARALIAPVSAGASGATDRALRLRAQGLVALAAGDIAGARAFLERAAEIGDARSLLVLGDTYDPATLNRLGALGLKGDPARARDYYARALSAGVAGARDRVALRDPQQY